MTPALAGSLMMIASGSIHAVVNAVVKGGRDRMASRAVIDGSSAIIALPAILLVPDPGAGWRWLGASALVHLVYLYALIRAYAVADFSAAYPVLRGTAPLLTAAVMVAGFGEAASPGELLGIAVLSCAMFAIVAGRHIGRAGLGWALLTGACIAAYTVIDAHGVRAAPTPASYIVWVFVLMGTLVVAMFGLASRGAIFAAAARQWDPGVIAGGLSIVTYGLAQTAFALGPTAPLAALRETGMITALLIATFVLGERVTIGRVAGVAGILIGAALILTR